MIVSPFYNFLVPEKTSSEEIKRKIKFLRLKIQGIMLVGMLGFFLVDQLILAPKIKDIYLTVEQPLPPIIQYLPYLFLLGLFVLGGLVYLLIENSDVSYTSIRTNEGYLQISPRYRGIEEIVTMVGMVVLITLIVHAYVWPIYSLSK